VLDVTLQAKHGGAARPHMKPFAGGSLESGWDWALSEVGEVWLGHFWGDTHSKLRLLYSTVELWRGGAISPRSNQEDSILGLQALLLPLPSPTVQ
jgi:hypothetical protein